MDKLARAVSRKEKKSKEFVMEIKAKRRGRKLFVEEDAEIPGHGKRRRVNIDAKFTLTRKSHALKRKEHRMRRRAAGKRAAMKNPWMMFVMKHKHMRTKKGLLDLKAIAKLYHASKGMMKMRMSRTSHTRKRKSTSSYRR